jgi:ribonucleotide reductase beta subunit family protein with ferritin-like domain
VEEAGQGLVYEPMLDPAQDPWVFTMDKCPKIYMLLETMWGLTWFPPDIDWSGDQKDWRAMKEDERHYVRRILMFFAASDGIVMQNINANFQHEVFWPEVRNCYQWQAAQEVVHSRVYAQAVQALEADADVRRRTLDGLKHSQAIQRKVEWVAKYMDRSSGLPFHQRVAAFFIVEILFFSSSFCGIYWCKKRNILPGLTHSNDFIARDEGMHVRIAETMLTEALQNKNSHETLRAMMSEAVECEVAFVEECLPSALLGINAQTASQYVRFVADYGLKMLGVEPLFKVENPFDWMELISLDGKTNFFEKRVAEYAKDSDAGHAEFALDEDF